MKRFLLALALALGLIGAGLEAYAAWQSNGSGGAYSKAVTVPAGNQPTTSLATATSITVSWSQVQVRGSNLGTLSGGGYLIKRYQGPTYASAINATNGCAGTISGAGNTLSCTETGLPDGDWKYTVTPALQIWRGSESPKSTPALTVVNDNTPPSATITFPTSTTYNTASWNAGCTSAICGTASDSGGSGLATVAVSIRQGSGNYWNGASFGSASQVFNTASGTTSWSYAFPATNFPADGSYTVQARATDGANNQFTTSTVTFTIDKTNPNATITFPTATSYNNAGWNAGCTSAICGTASDTTSGVSTVAVSIQQGSGNYWNGASFGSASQVFNTATGTTAWNYAFPATNFPAEGNYTVQVRATDVAGNVFTTSTVTFTIDRTGPTVTNVTLNNGGTLGTLDKNDTLVITYNEAIDASTFCNQWVNDGTNQAKSGNNVVTLTVTNSGSNDLLSSVTATGCTFHLGSVALNADYVTGNVSFSGTGSNAPQVTWNPTAKTLTIQFAGGSGQNSNVPASIPSYTPDATLKDIAGNSIGAGPFAGTSSRF